MSNKVLLIVIIPVGTLLFGWYAWSRTTTPTPAASEERTAHGVETGPVDTTPPIEALLADPEQSGDRSPAPPALTTFLDASKPIPERLPHDFERELVSIDTVWLAAVRRVAADRNETDVVRHEALKLLDRSQDPEALALLMQMLDRPDEGEGFAGFLVQHAGVWALATDDPERRQALRDRIARVLDETAIGSLPRREAILALTRLDDPLGQAVVAEGLKADHRQRYEGELDLYIRCARLQHFDEGLPQVRDLLDHPERAIRVAAIANLGQWPDHRSRDRIASLADHADPATQRAATMALRNLERSKNQADGW